jgi:hypothetical protein
MVEPPWVAIASLELPHWLMGAGALLVVAGFIGLALDRNKKFETDAEHPSDEPIARPRQQIPRLPTFSPYDET